MDDVIVPFLHIATGLGACFVWMVWEFQQIGDRCSRANHPWRRKAVSLPNEERRFDSSVLFACGISAAILLGIVLWFPSADTWIAESVEAENGTTQAVTEPRRRPIQFEAWTKVIETDR